MAPTPQQPIARWNPARDVWETPSSGLLCEHSDGNGLGKSLEIEAQRLLPTTRATDGTKGAVSRTATTDRRVVEGRANLPESALSQDWREYEPAIRRQENAFGRPAPAPTEPGKDGQPCLSPRFSEWLMGLPAGWVTDVPGLTRAEELKALGNGVVPQQCAATAHAFRTDLLTEVAA